MAKWIARGIALAGVAAMLSFAAAPLAAGEEETDPPATPTPIAIDESAPTLRRAAEPLAVQTVTPRAWLPIMHKPPAPAAFTKLSPAASATGIPATGTVLSWTVSMWATVYDVCVSQSVVAPCLDGSASGGFTRTTGVTNWGTGPLAPGQTYFWHVRARNASGAIYSDGGVGQTREFSVTPLPGAFNKSGPGSGTTGHPATGITLTWSASPNATGYQVCLSTSASACASHSGYTLNAGPATSYNTGPLAPGVTYYWNVRAINNNGTAAQYVTYANSNINQVWNFATLPRPGAFNKLQPANGSAPSNATLSWAPSVDAAGYRVCLNTSPSPCVGAGGGFTIDTANTTYNASGLTPGVTYFWHVRAYNASGVTYSDNSESAVWNFLAPAASGGTNPCNAGVASQNTDYTMPQNQTDIYYALVVNQPSTVDLSITGATGQLQLRTPNLSTCPNHTTTLIDYEPVTAGAASIRYYNVTPGTYYARIATTTPGSNNVTFRWSATPGHTFLEPNNTACAPATINLDTTYTAYPENSRPDLDLGSGVGAENDFYQFTLSAQTTVQVQFSGYNAGQRQVQLRGGACNSTSLIDSSAFVANATSGNIQRTLPAGTYWARFVTLDSTQSRTPYSFTVSTSAWAPRMNTCWPFPPDDSNCGNGSYSGGQLTVYWDGAPGATQVQAIFRGIGAGNCPRPPDRTETFAPGSVPQGSRQITGIQRGYYGLTLKISGPQGTYTRNEMPVKMDCEFMLASPLVEWPGLMGPQQDTTGPATSPAPRPTPIPMPGETPAPPPAPPLTVTPIP